MFNIENASIRQKANISGFLSENQGYLINHSNYNQLLALSTPSFHERADKLLLMLERKTNYAGEEITRDNTWVSCGWCINETELITILHYLMDKYFIRGDEKADHCKYKISSDGWAHLEKIKKVNRDSQQGFVAMWFDDSMTPVYDTCIHPAIEAAGYKPLRVDRKEHNDKIDDEIIAQIRRSRFVVADFTGQRGGVYFEAGFAKGLGLDVFWTCNKKCEKKLHFDTRQYNHIIWEEDKPEEFKTNLKNRIEAVLGHGSYRPDRETRE